MHDSSMSLQQLNEQIQKALEQFDFDTLQKKLADVMQQSQSPDFWQDQQKAQSLMQEQSKLQNRLQPWRELKAGVVEALELANLQDASLVDELEEQADIAAASAGGGGAGPNTTPMPAESSVSFKNFRHHPDMENFYRFIYENDLRYEALGIIDQVLTERRDHKKIKAEKTKGH